MFKKLKKKLEEETNTDIAPGLPLASSGSSISLSGSERETSPVKASSSHENLPNIAPLPVANETIKKTSTTSDENGTEKLVSSGNSLGIDILTAQLRQKSDKISTLENTVKDLYSQLIGEQKRNAKLSSDSDQAREKRSKSEREAAQHIEKLNRERVELEARLREALQKSERLAAQQESTEELDGFQSQEMAKVKHLLLKSQQDLSGKVEEARRYSNELLAANQRVRELESELQKSKEDISSVKSLQLEKRHLESEVDRLKQEALKSATRSSHMEKTLGELTDELDALKHVHEVYKSKNSSLLDEKDNEICHMQERVEVLEKRLAECDLSGDEKLEALLTERKTMEKKLEESRQHLSEVKTTWSEKIHSLENQIFHLNKKMAEDSEDSGEFEKRLEEALSHVATLKESNFKLEEMLSKMKEKNEKLGKEKDQAIEELKERLSKRESDLGGKVAQLEAQLTELRKSSSKEISDLQNRVSELVSSQTENVQKEIETEQKLTNLEDENKLLKSDLVREETEKISITEAYSATVANLQEAEKKVAKLENECSAYALQSQNIQAQLREERSKSEERKAELDRLMMRNAELSQQVELLKREAQEETNLREKEKEEYERQLASFDEKHKELQSKVAALEKGESERQAQNGLTEVQNSTILELQEKLLDRNKTIKLQQQRLGDMKKTLQRELKMQTNFDSSRDVMSSESLSHFGGLASSAAIISTTNLSTNESTRSQLRSSSPNGLRATNGSGSILSEGTPYDDVNFSYLRHVVFKFMTSPEYEAQHLVRAVAVLLHLTQEEEKFIKDILEWKMSWFGSKPQPGSRYYRTKPTQAPLLLSTPR